nr:hypothetical protein [Brucella anthropi]
MGVEAPLTVITVALVSASDGMNEMFSTSFATFNVYEFVLGAKAGAKVPVLGMRFCKSGFGKGSSIRFSALELKLPFPATLTTDPARILKVVTPDPDIVTTKVYVMLSLVANECMVPLITPAEEISKSPKVNPVTGSENVTVTFLMASNCVDEVESVTVGLAV